MTIVVKDVMIDIPTGAPSQTLPGVSHMKRPIYVHVVHA